MPAVEVMGKLTINIHTYIFILLKNDMTDKNNEQTTRSETYEAQRALTAASKKRKKKHTNKSTNNDNSIRSAS